MNAVALGFDGADSTKTLSHCLFRKVEGLSSSTRLSLYILGSTPGSSRNRWFQASRCQVVAHGSAPAC